MINTGGQAKAKESTPVKTNPIQQHNNKQKNNNQQNNHKNKNNQHKEQKSQRNQKQEEIVIKILILNLMELFVVKEYWKLFFQTDMVFAFL